MVSNYSLPPLPECLKIYGDTKAQKKLGIVDNVEPIYENVVTLRAQSKTKIKYSKSGNDCLGTFRTIPENCATNSINWFDHLKDDMTNLRELDKTLLQQLHTLNESIYQYKLLLSERHLDDTNSEYSYASVDRDMDSISSMDEFDYFTDDLSHDSPATTPVGPRETNIFFQINELHEKMQTELNI